MLYCLYYTYGYLYSNFNYNEIKYKIQLLSCTGHIPKSEKPHVLMATILDKCTLASSQKFYWVGLENSSPHVCMIGQVLIY